MARTDPTATPIGRLILAHEDRLALIERAELADEAIAKARKASWTKVGLLSGVIGSLAGAAVALLGWITQPHVAGR